MNFKLCFYWSMSSGFDRYVKREVDLFLSLSTFISGAPLGGRMGYKTAAILLFTTYHQLVDDNNKKNHVHSFNVETASIQFIEDI